MKNLIEREVKLILPSREKFNQLVNWDGKELGGWEANFKLSRRTIYLDTKSFHLEKLGYSLLLVPNINIFNSKQNKLVLKKKISGYDKQESVYEFDNEDGDILKHINQIVPVNLEEPIQPLFVLKQIRHKRGLMLNMKKLFISIDEVQYLSFNDINSFNDTLFICELESSGSKENLINESDFQPLIELLENRFNANLGVISKYSNGKKVLETGRWAFSNLFNSEEQWQSQFLSLKNRISNAISLGSVDENEAENITLQIDCLVNFGKIGHYSDTANEIFRKMLNQSIGLRNIWNRFLNLEIPNGDVSLEETIYRKVFNEIYVKDITFDDIQDSTNNNFKLTKENYSSFLASKDMVLRKEAFNSLYNSYSKYKNTIASCLDGIVSLNKHSHLQNSIIDENLREKILEFILKQNNENLHTLHRYMELRKQKLNQQQYSISDVQFPINHQNINITYTEAQDMILKVYSILDPLYQNQINSLFTKGYIDINNSKNKRFGSYLIDTVSPNWPFMSINYQSDLQSVISLVHEFGHAIANINLPALHSYRSVPQLTAEIHASIFESLLMYYIEKNLPYEVYIDLYLEKFRANYFRSMLLSEFEILIYNMKIKQNIQLTAEVLSGLYHTILVKYYGNSVELPQYISLEWTKIPFYYYNPKSIITYPLAFIIGEYIAKKILNNNFDVDGFYKKSAIKDTHQLLLDFNIDLLDKEIYQNFFGKFISLQDKY